MTAATDCVGFVLVLLASVLVAGTVVAELMRRHRERMWRRRNADWERDIRASEHERELQNPETGEQP